MKILVLAIGKLKSKPIQALVEDYASRVAHYSQVEIVACRDDDQALARIEPADCLVILDERGIQKSSEELAGFLDEHRMRGTKRLCFFIGGEDGVGAAISKRANATLGFSRMTFPHELMQAILLEQIYRAFSIIRGEPYHRK